MYVANTHLKPVIGIDIHFVNIPFPFPLPHPYIGLIIDPFDYIPKIGATVKINNVPRGVTDTGGMLITFMHIPFGAYFTLAPMIGHDSQNFWGDKKVNVEGTPLSGAGHVLMTCNDIGIPLSLGFDKFKKKILPIPSLYLPTSYVIPLQWGKPVMVGGPLTPHFNLMSLVHAAAFGAALKVVGKLGGKLLKKLAKKLPDSGLSGKAKRALCRMGREPVDLVTGRVNYELEDFKLPGAIPIVWTRIWDSDASFNGLLGHGVHMGYDLRIQLWPEEGCMSMTTEDGRQVAFPILYHGESYYHPQEKMLLRRKQNGHFLLEDYEAQLYYHFNYDEEPNIWRLSFLENYSGNRIQFHYTGSHLRAITDCAGRQLILDLDKQHRITRVIVHHRNTKQVLVQYGYNEEGDLVSIFDAMGQETRLEFEDHLMVKKTDRNGMRFYWEYDAQRRCVHTWGDGGVLEGFIQYGKGYNVVTDSLGNNTTYFYDENNLCIQETDHYGNHTYTEYTEDFEIYREIDEEGNITGYVYDDRNMLKEKILPDGQSIVYQYNEFNQLTQIFYPDGSNETFSYDAQRRLRVTNNAIGKIMVYEYNVEGQLEKVIEQGKRTTKLTWDEDDNMVQLDFPEGTTATWKYDDLGNCMQTTTANGFTRYFEYDALRRVRNIHLADGNTVSLNYDAYEDVTSASDKFTTVQFEYSAFGDVKKRRQGSAEMEFLYDTEGRLRTIINEAGRHYNFEYDHRGDVIQETGFGGMQLKFERDAIGRVIKTIRPGDRYTEYEYDVNGKIIRASYQDGSWEMYNYDKSGKLIEAINEHCTIRYTYNKAGQVVTEEQDGYKVSVSYDEKGNRTRVTSNLGADIKLKYDALGWIGNIQADFQTAGRPTAASWQAAFTHNLSGSETTRELPGGIKSEWVHNRDGQPSEHKLSKRGVVQSWKKYTWNSDDRLVNIFDALTKGNTHFKHDTASALVFAQYADNSIVHRIPDATGNLYETKEMTDRRYNATGALLESRNFTYEYDEEGNLVSKTEKAASRDGRLKKTTYEWFGNGMLKKVTRPDGKTVSFRYDAQGRRIEKLVVQHNDLTQKTSGTITRWVWDGDVPLHEWTYNEKDRPQALVNEWGEIQYDREEPNPQNETEGITWVFEANNFIPCAKLTSNQSYSIICDHLGTPREAYDEQGNKAWSRELDIYGRIRGNGISKTAIPFRFQGQYEDEETGLYYNRFRYYSPEEGTYISQDPMLLEGGTRMYSYVNDPNALIDIFGLNPTYWPLDNLGRATGANATVTKQSILAKTGTKAGSVDPAGWNGAHHPYHQQRGHLIAKQHGGSGTDKRNLVTIKDGTNHPGMTHYERIITDHAMAGNTVEVIVKPMYRGTNKKPYKVHMYAVDQNGKVIVNDDVGFREQKRRKCPECCKRQ